MSEEAKGGISIGQAMTVLGNLGVIVGLIFVGMELQQNRINLQAEIELGLASSYQEAMGRTVESPAVAQLLQTAFLEPDSLTGIQTVQLMSWNAEWMAVVYATYRLRELGAVDEQQWLQHSSYFMLFFQTEWMRSFWRETNHGTYPADFLAELEQLVPQGEP